MVCVYRRDAGSACWKHPTMLPAWSDYVDITTFPVSTDPGNTAFWGYRHCVQCHTIQKVPNLLRTQTQWNVHQRTKQ
ncbi:hypothetical protein BH23CHL4_BH23CHL4_06570 [soil metagenome]